MPKKEKRTPFRLGVFDTEGTTIKVGDGGFALLYFWDFLIAPGLDCDTSSINKSNVSDVCTHISGRDVSSLYTYMHGMLDDAMDLGFRWLIGVHNLSYDIAYIRHFLVSIQSQGYEVTVSAKSSTKFLTVNVSYDGIMLFTFFDTLALFGVKLATLGRNLGFPKFELDYDTARTPDTELSDDELAYNHRDTEVLMVAVCQSLLKRKHVDINDLGKTLLTKTSIVRVGDREDERIGMLVQKVKADKSKHGRLTSRTLYDLDRDIVRCKQFKTLDDYMVWESYGATLHTDVKGIFAGGVNLSNANVQGLCLHNVHSFDLKSAYPAIMLSYRIPCDFKEVTESGVIAECLERKIPDVIDIIQCRERFWIGTVTFHDIHVRREWVESVGDVSITETCVLQNKDKSENVVFVDGHLSSAKKLTLTLSSSMFYELSIQFEWDTCECESLKMAFNSRPPTDFTVIRTLFHYVEKTVAKDVSKAFKAGQRISTDMLKAWLDAGYISYDEFEALTEWNIDADWVEGFVLNHKSQLNSLYGINVTSPLKDEFELGNDGFLKPCDGDAFERYKESGRNSLMWREAGVCIALFNRYKIVYMAALAVDAGSRVFYTDTDSIKVDGDIKTLAKAFEPLHKSIERFTSKTVEDAITRVNGNIRACNERLGTAVDSVAMPTDQAFRDLGKLDYEGTYDRFVTTGHKKYALTEDGNDEWQFKCSGYDLGVLKRVGKWLERMGVDIEDIPLGVIGYGIMYRASTGIARMHTCPPDTWVDVEFNGYRGSTCPGMAILDSDKVMNRVTSSILTYQRYKAAKRNCPYIDQLSFIQYEGVEFNGIDTYVMTDWSDE